MQRSLLLVLVLLIITPSHFIAAAEFVEIGRFETQSPQISANGLYVVGQTLSFEAFRWSRETGVELLGKLSGDLESRAVGISADGSIVVGSSGTRTFSSPPQQAFRWTEDTGIVGLGHPLGFNHNTGAEALSSNGMTIVGETSYLPSGGSFEDLMTEPLRWTAEGGMTSLGLPEGTQEAWARDVSADGTTVVGYGSTGNNVTPFLWNEQSGYHELGPLPAGWDHADAWRVSADGSTVVGIDNERSAAGRVFRWTYRDGFHEIPFSDVSVNDEGVPRGISADGSIVVGTSRNSTARVTTTPYVWDIRHGTRNLRDVLVADHGFSEADLPELGQVHDLTPDATTILGVRGLVTNTPNAGVYDIWAIYLDKPLVSFGLDGDYNNNGQVEQTDLDLVLLHWGVDAATVSDSWANDLPTGTIDQDELDGVLLNWGNSAAVAATNVPEPSAFALLLTTLLASTLLRRKRSQTGSTC